MKLAKLSLAAMVVAGLASSSFAADTLADAFKNGKVNGELKAWYFDQSKDPAYTNANMINLGIELGYVTDSFYGFTFGATFQGSGNPATAETSAKTVFVNDQYAGGAQLSEAYLAYTLGKTTVKAGRQYIATPLVNGSGSRIFKEAFEGVVLVNTDLPQTTLIAGFVDKFQGRTSAIGSTTTGDAPKFRNSAAFTGGTQTGLTATFDEAYTVGVINKSITNLTLTAQYAIVTDVADADDVDVYYTEANYVLPVAGFKLGFDANFRGSKTGSALDALNMEGHYTAARISLSELAGFGASFAYGVTSKSDSVIAGMGNGPTSYTSTMIRGTSSRMGADTDSYLFQASYDFGKLGVTGLTALAQYGWTDQGNTAGNVDFKNVAGGLTYAIPAVKGLTTSLQYETQEKDANGVKTDTDELWFKAGYKF
ncbi:MAG: OprD family outer membrane porin [Sulfurospirillum sp.]